MTLKMLVIIVNREDGRKTVKICEEKGHHVSFTCFGSGTASSEILECLGIGETEKCIVMTLLPEGSIPELQEELMEKIRLYMPGKGILFVLPLSGISCRMSQAIVKGIQEEISEEESVMKSGVKEEIMHDLIVSVVNRGDTEIVMDAAKTVKNVGGTVLHARGIGSADVEEFLGFKIAPEREVVGIIVKRELKQDILKAINKAAGLCTESKGIIFSIPIDGVMGLR